MWAITSGAARNGVFHRYSTPKTELERILESMGISRKVIERVDKIDIVLEVGGHICNHCIDNWGYGSISDGTYENLTEPEYAPNDYFNKCHRGCMISTYQTHVFDATYVIYYSVGTYINGCIHRYIQRVIITPQANEKEVIKRLSKI